MPLLMFMIHLEAVKRKYIEVPYEASDFFEKIGGVPPKTAFLNLVQNILKDIGYVRGGGVSKSPQSSFSTHKVLDFSTDPPPSDVTNVF